MKRGRDSGIAGQVFCPGSTGAIQVLTEPANPECINKTEVNTVDPCLTKRETVRLMSAHHRGSADVPIRNLSIAWAA